MSFRDLFSISPAEVSFFCFVFPRKKILLLLVGLPCGARSQTTTHINLGRSSRSGDLRAFFFLQFCVFLRTPGGRHTSYVLRSLYPTKAPRHALRYHSPFYWVHCCCRYSSNRFTYIPGGRYCSINCFGVCLTRCSHQMSRSSQVYAYAVMKHDDGEKSPRNIYASIQLLLWTT